MFIIGVQGFSVQGFSVQRFNVQGSAFRVKDKEGIKAP
jgi:hypothetical protein